MLTSGNLVEMGFIFRTVFISPKRNCLPFTSDLLIFTTLLNTSQSTYLHGLAHSGRIVSGITIGDFYLLNFPFYKYITYPSVGGHLACFYFLATNSYLDKQ
jgi:hypothetical protein